MSTLTIGAHEAKVHFSEYLSRVERGDTIAITKHGRAVATIVPSVQTDAAVRIRARRAIEIIRSVSKGQTLGGLKIKDLINEGRP